MRVGLLLGLSDTWSGEPCPECKETKLETHNSKYSYYDTLTNGMDRGLSSVLVNPQPTI